ncbi:hypothetical protein ACWGKS_00565 [Nocardiopsis sp. NPDC055879]
MRRRREDETDDMDDVDDVEIRASVSAEELLFHEEPDVRTRVRGTPDRESLSVRERDGLPWRVRGGEVYRGVHVDYRLAGAVRASEDDSEPEHGDDGRESGPSASG